MKEELRDLKNNTVLLSKENHNFVLFTMMFQLLQQLCKDLPNFQNIQFLEQQPLMKTLIYFGKEHSGITQWSRKQNREILEIKNPALRRVKRSERVIIAFVPSAPKTS